MPGVHRRLSARPPFDGAGVVAFLARRAVPGVEEVVDGGYRRSLRLAGGAGTVVLVPRADHMEARFDLDDARDLDAAVAGARRLFDLEADPAAILDVLAPDPLVGPLARAAPGRRVPGHPDPPELAVRAVLGQQVSLAGAATLAGRLVAAHGVPLARPLGAVTHVFPTAAALAAAAPESLAMPRARAAALLGLCAALAGGELALDPAGDLAAARAALLARPGIGPWTVEYVAMRALGDPDAFLPTDLGVRHALTALGADPKPRAATERAEGWRPFRAYALQHLWATLP